MDFLELYNRISPRLKRLARTYRSRLSFIDEDDLYQEMCMHLWNNFKDGIPAGINDSYIIKGCEFHILNFLRTKREKAQVVSLEQPINENGYTLKDILYNKGETLDKYVDRKTTIDSIMNNGFTKREKDVFSLLLKGYTLRETGQRLGISHVMVVKLKHRLINKWQKKKNKGYQTRRIFT